MSRTPEFCAILSGRVGLIDNEDYHEEIFVAGDSFFLPKGSSLTWVIYETVRKFYMTAEWGGPWTACPIHTGAPAEHRPKVVSNSSAIAHGIAGRALLSVQLRTGGGQTSPTTPIVS